MPRKVRDSSLETRTARAKLKARHKPFFRLIEPGLHLGYRKLASGPGTWVARRYSGDGQYVVENLRTPEGALIIADDFSDADGVGVLTFGQAQAKAREVQRAASTTASSLTVRQAVEAYITERDARETRRKGRPVRSDAHRLGRYVIGREQRGKREAIAPSKIADISLHALSDGDLIKWRSSLPATMTATSKKRTINDLKAALNSAYAANRKQLHSALPDEIKHGLKAESDDGETDTIARDNQILSDAQVSALIGAAREVDGEGGWDGDLYRMTVALATTGARFSQAVRIRVGDCQSAEGRLLVPRSRKGKGKSGSASVPVPVGKDTLRELQPATTGRASNEWLLERWRHQQVSGGKWERSERGPWQSASEFGRAWESIRDRAKMPEVIPYALRHSSIVRGIRANLPIRLVAAMHDTSVQMIERHYAKYIVDGLEELAARAVVPLVPVPVRRGTGHRTTK